MRREPAGYMLLMEDWLLPKADPERRLDLLAKAFLKADGRALLHDLAVSPKGDATRLPDLDDCYALACDAIQRASDRLATLRMVENTRAALTIADWLIARYEQLKTGRGFLDFNDLISRTVRLLARQDAGPWVLYKLDKGIDHILLDEAQDTSPEQWGVVRPLGRRVLLRRWGARHRPPHGVCRRRRKAVDLFIPGRRAEAFAESGLRSPRRYGVRKAASSM